VLSASVGIPKRLLTLFLGAWRRHGKWILCSRADISPLHY